jgi:hypothetical protein
MVGARKVQVYDRLVGILQQLSEAWPDTLGLTLSF